MGDGSGQCVHVNILESRNLSETMIIEASFVTIAERSLVVVK